MKKEYVLAALSIFFWSTVATVSKLLLGEINNFQLLWANSFFAAAALAVYNIVTGRIKELKGYKLKDYIKIVLISFPGLFLYYAFYYGGTAMMPASQAFIVNYMWPMMSVIFACIILGERLTFRKAIAILISFSGVIIVTGADLKSLDVKIIAGAVLCILGAVSYGLFTALNQKESYTKSLSNMIGFASTFVLTGVINAVRGDLFIPSAVQLAGFAWNGIFAMAIATTAWILALKSGKTAKISNLAYITPFISLVWTSLILKEQISWYSVIGLLFIVGGILIQLNDKKVMEETSYERKKL